MTGPAGRPSEHSGARWRRPVELATVAAAGTAAAGPVVGLYAPGPVPVLLPAAAVLGAGVTAGLRALRVPATPALLLSLAALGGGLAVAAGWLPRPGGPLPGAVLAAVRDSGALILTTSVPVPVSLATVALPVSATWLAAAGSTGLLATGRPALAAAPPVALFAAALALVGPPRTPAYGPAVALLVALVWLLALVEQRTAGRLRGPATVVFTGLLVTAVGLGGPVLAGLATRPPPDLRAAVEPPYLNPTQVNPLSLLAGWAREPGRELIRVRTDRPQPLRWVVLPEFTGVTWRPAPRYQAAGPLLPAQPGQPEAAPEVVRSRHEITITGLAGSWLPAPRGAREVRGVPVTVDRTSGTLLAQAGLGPGTTYTVRAARPVWDTPALVRARLSPDPGLDASRTLPPGAPGRLHEIARIAAGTGSPHQQASRVATYLRETYVYDPEAPGGNGYPSLARFLDPAAPGGGRGTSEQFAAAFAVLTRSLGIPSRLVVGFRPGEPTADGHLLRTGDGRAWAEVHLDGIGWVPFDPTPRTRQPDRPAQPRTSALAALFPPESGPEGAAADTPEPAPDAAGPAAAGTGPATGPESRLAPVSLALLAGGLAAAAAVAALRLRRSARHLAPGAPADRLLGGWRELRDGLRLAGRRPDPASTVDELAQAVAAAARVPQAQVAVLAAAVNAVAFSGSRSPVVRLGTTGRQLAGEAAAAELLHRVRGYRRALRRHAGGLRRLGWWLDPRPLWWR